MPSEPGLLRQVRQLRCPVGFAPARGLFRCRAGNIFSARLQGLCCLGLLGGDAFEQACAVVQTYKRLPLQESGEVMLATELLAC